MNPDNSRAEVQIPVQGIETRLLHGALPGFNGSLTLSFEIGAGAIEFVSILTERNGTLSAKSAERASVSTEDQRRARVRQKVLDVAEKLRMKLGVVQLVAHYHDGLLEKFEVVDRPE